MKKLSRASAPRSMDPAFMGLLTSALVTLAQPAQAGINKCIKGGKTVFQQLPCEPGTQDKSFASQAPTDAFAGCFYVLGPKSGASASASSGLIDHYEIRQSSPGTYSYTGVWGREMSEIIAKEGPGSGPDQETQLTGKMVPANAYVLGLTARFLGMAVSSGVVDESRYGSRGIFPTRPGIFKTANGYYSTFGEKSPVTRKPCPGATRR